MRQKLPRINRKHVIMNILCIESFCPQKKTHNRTLLSSRILLKRGRHFDYWNQPLDMRMCLYYLDSHEAALCCYLVIQKKKLTLPRAMEAKLTVKKSSVFWDITLCIPLKVNWSFGGTSLLLFKGQRISQARNQCEAGSCKFCCWFLAFLTSAPKMEVTCSSRTLIDYCWTTHSYISEDRTLHNYCCENLKSFNIYYCSEFSCWLQNTEQEWNLCEC
jgi:hypothetical protein